MLTSLLFASAVVAQKPDTVADQNRIRAAYRQMERAIEREDARALGALIAPGFKKVLPKGGARTRAQVLREASRIFRELQEIEAEIQVLLVDVSGNTATTEVRYIVTGERRRNRRQEERHEASARERWRKVGSRWMYAHSKVHETTRAVNGRIVAHQP